MRRKPAWAATAMAAGAAVVLAAGLAPAQAATPGWRIDQVFGGNHFLYVQAIDATSSANAWMLGILPDPEPFLVVQRWDGTRWVKVPLTLPSFVVGLDSAIYASSPTDAWLFPQLQSHQGFVQDAVHWDGTKWAISAVDTTTSDTVIDAAVFSPSNVWAFGERRPVVPGYGAAFVRHWDGTAWQPEPVPVGTPVTVDGIAPDDIWALGVAAATVNTNHQVMVAMHYDGTKWSALHLPTFPPVRRGYPWVPSAISATSANDVWVEDTPLTNQQTGYSPPGLILLHWDGSSWHTVTRDPKLQGVNGLTPDGHGGFWLTAGVFRHASGARDLVHFSHGTFTSQPAPALNGYRGSLAGIAAVPGTAYQWAWGELVRTSGAGKGDIVRYTP